jgi:hypothetical protein
MPARINAAMTAEASGRLKASPPWLTGLSRKSPTVAPSGRVKIKVEETDIDGFNLSRIVTPESLEDFVDLVVPILQERGVYKHDYLPGTLREKLFGQSRLLPPSHPAAAYRHVADNISQSR